MIVLRSSPALLYKSLLRNLLKPTTLYHLSFSSKPFSHKPKPLSISLNPLPNMSSRPSAFDLLMSKSRSFASRNPQASSSPNKRKTLNVQNPKPGISSTNEIQKNAEEPSLDHKKPMEIQQIEPQDSVEAKTAHEPVDNYERPDKKPKVVSAHERIAELKSKMVFLKEKPDNFDPKTVACWEKGERVPFIFLSLAFDMISNESGRIVITNIVCNMLRTVIDTTPEDLVAVVYLAANRIAPAHEGLELGIGDASIIKALAEAYGRTDAQVKKQYKVHNFLFIFFFLAW